MNSPHVEPPRPEVDAADRSGGVVVLDGGMSNALQDRGHDLSGLLWTARLLRDAPDEIAAVHASYFEAGARVATTASYQASVPGFVDAGMDRAQAEQLIRRSVTVARDMRDRLSEGKEQLWVAASVGPYGAVLADGSEYRGRYGLSASELREFHLPRIELLATAGPDLLAVETIPDLDEAEVLLDLVDEIGIPAWFSFSIQGLQTRAGQPLDEAFAAVASTRSVFAVGVNCCRPSDVLDAVELAAHVTQRPVVAYPNSGEDWNAGARSWAGGPSYDVGLAPAWVQAGARYVGGCCRIGPRTIAELAATLGA
jgi:homocysteine S-methyltransferase